MRRVLESGGIEHEDGVRSRVIAADRREVSVARLPERAPRVVDDEHGRLVSRRDFDDVLTEALDAVLGTGPMQRDLRAAAPR